LARGGDIPLYRAVDRDRLAREIKVVRDRLGAGDMNDAVRAENVIRTSGIGAGRRQQQEDEGQ